MSGIIRIWSARECVLGTSCKIDLAMRLVIVLLFTCQMKALIFCALLSVERVLVCNKWCRVSRRVSEWST